MMSLWRMTNYPAQNILFLELMNDYVVLVQITLQFCLGKINVTKAEYIKTEKQLHYQIRVINMYSFFR